MKYATAILIVIILLILTSASAPPDWLTARFDADWYVELQPNDVIYYLDDNRDLHSLVFDGVSPNGDCMFGLDDVSMGVYANLYAPETAILPWRGCNKRTGLMLVWSSPVYHEPDYNVDEYVKCDANIDATEAYAQECEENVYWWLGHSKTLIEVIEYE